MSNNNLNNVNNKKFSWIKALLGLLSFSTILPIKVHTSVPYMSRAVWLWPFVQLIVGFITAVLAYLLLNLANLSPLFVAILVFAFLMIMSGFNHMDGLMDMADGLMVHGSPRDRLRVMKDSMVGTGGIMAGIIISLITIGGLTNVLDYNFILGIIVIEMLSKTSLLTTALVSTPFNGGMGRYVIGSVNSVNFGISVVVVAIISYLLCSWAGIFALLGAVIAGGIVAYVARNKFTCANGDVLGASNEIGRVIALLFMVLGLIFLM